MFYPFYLVEHSKVVYVSRISVQSYNMLTAAGYLVMFRWSAKNDV